MLLCCQKFLNIEGGAAASASGSNGLAVAWVGNIASGSVITTLIYGGLASLSSMVLGLFPGALGSVLSKIPLLSFGLPAILSLYFDFFSSVLQAFIFCTLTMIYISGAADPGE